MPSQSFKVIFFRKIDLDRTDFFWSELNAEKKTYAAVDAILGFLAFLDCGLGWGDI